MTRLNVFRESPGARIGRRVVVDAAVVGFARDRGVGDGDDGRGQPGGAGVGGQQHRARAAAARAACAARRSAAAPPGRRRRGPSRRRRSGTAAAAWRRPPGRSRPPGSAGRSPLSVMNPASVPGPTGSPNCATFVSPGEPSTTRCTSSGRADREALRVEVVAHDEIRNTLPDKGIGEPRRRSARGEQPLHRVEGADGLRRGQRDRVAHAPRAGAEHLQRFVVTGAPHLRRERRAGHHQHAAAAGWSCSSSQSAASCQYCGIAVNVPGGVSRPVHASDVATVSATRTTAPTATRLSRSGCASACSHSRRGTLPGSGIRPSRCARPEHQRQPEQRLELVHVAQRRAAGVEEGLHVVGERASRDRPSSRRPAGRCRRAGS